MGGDTTSAARRRAGVLALLGLILLGLAVATGPAGLARWPLWLGAGVPFFAEIFLGGARLGHGPPIGVAWALAIAASGSPSLCALAWAGGIVGWRWANQRGAGKIERRLTAFGPSLWALGLAALALIAMDSEPPSRLPALWRFALAWGLSVTAWAAGLIAAHGSSDAAVSRAQLSRLAEEGVGLLPAVALVWGMAGEGGFGVALGGVVAFGVLRAVGHLVVGRLERLSQRVAALELVEALGLSLTAALREGEVVAAVNGALAGLVPDGGEGKIVRLEPDRPGAQVWQVLPPGPAQASPLSEREEQWLREKLGRCGAEICEISAAEGGPGLLAPMRCRGELLGCLLLSGEGLCAEGCVPQEVLGAMAAQGAAAFENTRLYSLATVDGLTGLAVRRYFDLRLVEELRLVERHGGDFGLLIIDLDDFKEINDRWGHPAGDAFLQRVSAALREAVREADTVARYGGEEFAVLMPRAKTADTWVVAERIRDAVASARVPWQGTLLRATASVGAGSWGGVGADRLDDLVAAVDKALYRAKAQGKDRTVLASALAPKAEMG